MDKQIQKAIDVLNQGGIVIFPTDTAFGIGCKISNEKAVERLFKIRQRPERKAAPVLLNGIKMAERYLKEIKPETRKLMEEYWPGALTIVDFCKTERIPSLVRGGGKTLGVRMPNCKEVLALVAGVSEPILGPSANFSGGKTPFGFNDLDKELIRKVDFVFFGKTNGFGVSTVIDCTKSPFKTLRQGAALVKSL
ncbi:threonylcarbamoyl-AMP synthase [Patescibacteria group bacterium]|nr:threonylcarbamoyl-AMP synthase [Patescibacteria group bacterium]